ncbi:hypothetical protein [Xanthomonas vesicatoria]|uniref:Uncharacterized protein n=1 Tax=Xanthomonas vesicatoria ATCC 35937 TaxID=925775 RepID=F0BEW3_9XANT|nr:hypothetical protein [Xanthomonas vesicatoria]APP74478.1 hypothetical protein BJD12_03505 [Xanthomonas vesicatoria ATCC 35937]EGD08983.1 hypothetical protein XVE_2743 [Xanthomonas vesicatoria ATCC 35937]KTF32526.1 hypothetical protein LMG920_12715 [Xanthomonas vesicatoria]KTF38239.1 hypothetical protein LMG919_03705 [Xanthomonas vesicatoria]MCC8556758.1 hypothetical protein [Xanthomonas vesicatoria]
MEDQLNSVLMLLLGWLLGTLSPAIVDAIKSKRETALGREAIENELREFSSIILAACFRTSGLAGQIDRAFLNWQKGKLEADPGNERSAKFLAMTNQLLAFPDDQIAGASQTADAKATLLQKYAVPLLDYRVSALQTFDARHQTSLLEIRRNISLLDSIVDQSREFYRMTFVQLPEGNYDIIRANLGQTYSEYTQRAKVIVDQFMHSGWWPNNSFRR